MYAGPQVRAAAEVRARQNLTALQALGFAVTVFTTPDPEGREHPEVKTILLDPLPRNDFAGLAWAHGYRRQVSRMLAPYLAQPGAILFCEHIHALASCPKHPRLIYSCHDLIFQLTRLRRNRSGEPVRLKTRLYWRYLEGLERRLWRKARKIITVSASEAAKISMLAGRPAEYIPTVPPQPEQPLPAENFAGPARFWFYGSSAATANKIMLDHLAAGLLAQIQAACPGAEFHQVGKFDTYDPEKIGWLRQNFTVHGFVDDTTKLFRRGDICLIPYELDTGFRTKLPELCGLGMIAAGYPATFACCPEMRDGYNCIVGANPAELAAKLGRASADGGVRRKLAEGALETARRDFAPAGLLEKYRKILSFPS